MLDAIFHPGAKGIHQSRDISPDRPAEEGLPLPRRLWAIAAISFGVALFVIDTTIPNVALPTIADDLKVSSGTITNVVTVYQLVMLAVLLPCANIGDRIGHRRLYQYGQILFCLASAAAWFVSSFAALLVVRAVQSLGAGMALSVSPALLRKIYPERLLGMGFGINSIVVATGNAAAPTLGGVIAASYPWQLEFVVAAPLGLISLLLGRSLPRPEPMHVEIDWRDGIWSAATLLLLVGGIELAMHGGLLAAGLGCVAVGVVSAVLLLRREARRERPVLPVVLMRMPSLGLPSLGAVAAFLASAVIIVVLPFRFEQGMGYTPDQVGLLVLPFPVTLLFVGPLSGWLSDRMPAWMLGMAGMGIAIVGLVSLAMMPQHLGAFGIGWRLAICAAGFGLFFSPNSRAIVGGAPEDRAAAAGGLLSTSRLFGQALGAASAGVLLTLNLGLGPAPMVLAIVLAALAGVCMLARARVEQPPRARARAL
jgi:DHA2 family multidrug resistance protein-like MFS transporter